MNLILSELDFTFYKNFGFIQHGVDLNRVFGCTLIIVVQNYRLPPSIP